MTEPEIDPEMKKYIDDMLEYEKSAYEKATGGDYDGALSIWEGILNDSTQKDFFGQVPEALDEIYWNAAAARWAKGEPDKSKELISQGGLDWNSFETEVGADA